MEVNPEALSVVSAAIERAVAAERERCAKIAEGENQERLARLIRRGHQ